MSYQFDANDLRILENLRKSDTHKWALSLSKDDTNNVRKLVEIALETSAKLAAAERERDELKVKCNDCGGYLVFKREGSEVVTFHDCKNGKAARVIWDELRKDKERLDWLERDMPLTIMKYRVSECVGDVVQVGEYEAKTMRAAIDAAMNTGKDQKVEVIK